MTQRHVTMGLSCALALTLLGSLAPQLPAQSETTLRERRMQRRMEKSAKPTVAKGDRRAVRGAAAPVGSIRSTASSLDSSAIDQLLEVELARADREVSALIGDEDFVRRAH